MMEEKLLSNTTKRDGLAKRGKPRSHIATRDTWMNGLMEALTGKGSQAHSGQRGAELSRYIEQCNHSEKSY